MPLNRSKPYRLRPRSLADTLDGTNAPPGACASLANLIPDPGTLACYQCRPAAQIVSAFPDIAGAGVVSAALQIGTRIYGMIASSLTPGKDQPFCYDTKTGNFLTVNGATPTNVPTTPASSGEWVPPTMVAVGTIIILTHPGFSGGGNPFFGWFDTGGSVVNTTGNTTNGSPSITGNPATNGLLPGTLITGTAIPANTTVVNYELVTPQTTGDTHTSTTVDNLGSLAGIAVGQIVSGVGIATGTTVAAVGGSSITLSQAATASNAGETLSFSGAVITMSANATGDHSNEAIVLTGGTLDNPLYGAGNTTGEQLPTVPTSVQQFNNRAWFACGQFETFTDVLSLNVTSLGAQTLTIGDPSPITAQYPLSIVTTTGVVVLGLIVFKENYITQISGDPTTSNLAENAISTEGAGTQSGRSVAGSPYGILFMDADGVRLVTQTGTVSDPLPDVREPFINAVTPSRASASFNKGVYRICVENGAAQGTPFQEYWFDFKYKCWTGPHTFRQDLCVPIGGTFFAFDSSHPAKIYQSDPVQNSTSNFVENASILTWRYAANLPDDGNLMMNSLVVSSINLAFKSGAPPVQCVAQDEDGSVLNVCNIVPPGQPSVWGQFIWGVNIWFGSQFGLKPNIIPWTVPICFSKLSVSFASQSSLGFQISNFQCLYQALGYVATPYGLPADSSPVPPVPPLTENWDVGLDWDESGIIWEA